MRLLVLAVLLVCAAPSMADGRFNCGDLAGTWQGERFDKTLGAQRTSIVTFYETGVVVIDFTFNDGVEIESHRQYAHWSCEADVLTLDYTESMPDGPVDSYVINELNTSYVAYAGATNNCGNRRGDCGALTYEMVRLPDPPPGDESCGC